MLERKEAIQKMNELGAHGIPFFFFTDFLGSKSYIETLDNLSEQVEFQFHQEGSTLNSHIPNNFYFQKYPISFNEFKNAFDFVVNQINLGNSYLVNLTFETPIETSLSIKEIYQYSRARYKIRFKDEFVVFSPETFIQIHENQILSYPMKGTIDADSPNAKQTILQDSKEIAEHVTIVDLIRNDLSQISNKVTVPDFRFITEVNTHEKSLLQVSSEIRGSLSPNWKQTLGDLLYQLLPAGSISGAPKKETVRIIQQAESYNRGFYTGICGVFDGQSFDSGVMIRFIENKKGKLVYKSGGGITSFSSAISEYQEIIDKVYVPF